MTKNRKFAAKTHEYCFAPCNTTSYTNVFDYLAADREVVEYSSLKDISIPTLKKFLFEKYADKCSQAGIERAGLENTELKDIVKAIDSNFTIFSPCIYRPVHFVCW